MTTFTTSWSQLFTITLLSVVVVHFVAIVECLNRRRGRRGGDGEGERVSINGGETSTQGRRLRTGAQRKTATLQNTVPRFVVELAKEHPTEAIGSISLGPLTFQ